MNKGDRMVGIVKEYRQFDAPTLDDVEFINEKFIELKGHNLPISEGDLIVVELVDPAGGFHTLKDDETINGLWKLVEEDGKES